MQSTNANVARNANRSLAQPAPSLKISTNKLAQKLGVEAQTIRAGYCRKGHYLGLIPVVLPNGHLRWDDFNSDRVLAGEEIVGGTHYVKHVHSDRSAKARAAAAKSVAVRRAKREAGLDTLAGRG